MFMVIKRLIDLFGAAAVLLVLSPLLLITMLCIWLEDGLPIFFTQRRAGQGESEFDILKFRSMRINNEPAETMGIVTGSHPLITRTGRFIRRFKIDELPQLFNVLKGEMSLVGPRPTLLAQVRDYDAFERRRLEMKPGMTGWTQVNGSINLPWDERIALDVWYTENWSLLLDFKILLQTVEVVLFGETPNPRVLAEAAAYAQRAKHSPKNSSTNSPKGSR